MMCFVCCYGSADQGQQGTITWLSLLVIALILGVGLSWAHIRRALTGQYSVDDVED